MSRQRKFIGALGLAAISLLLWQIAPADAPPPDNPAQRQVHGVITALIDSEAEHATGTYIPGVGTVFTLDLLRGPNSVKGQSAYQGTRDWAIYLMQTFGSRVDAMPPTETVAFSIEFYDYVINTFRQLVITSRAEQAADPGAYQIYLDGKPYNEVVGGAPAAPVAQDTPIPPTATSAPQAAPTSAPQAAPAETAAPVAAGPVNITLNASNAQDANSDWQPIAGQWGAADEGYSQNQLGFYDLVSYYRQPVAGDVLFEVTMKYLSGDMGGGMVFNAPSNRTKQGAYMVSYTGKGTYLQWGYYDNGGVFQYQGGLGTASGADGQWHTLSVHVTGNVFEVQLDHKTVGADIPLNGTPGGYVGLLASTSQIVFNNVKAEAP